MRRSSPRLQDAVRSVDGGAPARYPLRRRPPPDRADLRRHPGRGRRGRVPRRSRGRRAHRPARPSRRASPHRRRGRRPVRPARRRANDRLRRASSGAGRPSGQRAWLPVYLYGEAARRPERRVLANVRRGEYEGLQTAIATDPARAPDFGPRALGPAGAVAVGARGPLIAFNVLLATQRPDDRPRRRPHHARLQRRAAGPASARRGLLAPGRGASDHEPHRPAADAASGRRSPPCRPRRRGAACRCWRASWWAWCRPRSRWTPPPARCALPAPGAAPGDRAGLGLARRRLARRRLPRDTTGGPAASRAA